MTAAGLVAALPGAQAQEPVDVALVLAVDVSRSMSPRELTIQREGYAAALNHPDVVRAIAQGAYGRIAITMFEWAGNGSVREVFDWTPDRDRGGRRSSVGSCSGLDAAGAAAHVDFGAPSSTR